jgi:hypothetical protein
VPADDVFLPGTDQVRPRIYPLLDLLAVQAREVMTDKELSVEVRAKAGSTCDPSFLSVKAQGCDYWRLTAYQAIAITNYLKSEGKLSDTSLAPVGRGTAPPAFVSESDRDRLADSTVEFIYQSAPMDLEVRR